jgi:asparagine synthase (glutamine-hydrolysing)
LESYNKTFNIFSLDFAPPFLDRELLAFMLSIPGEMQCPGGIPKGILRIGLRSILPHSITNRRWKADFTFHAYRGFSRELTQIRELLLTDSIAASMGYLDLKSLSAALEGANSPEALNWETLRILNAVGLELWLRAFHGHNRRRKNGSIYVNESQA